jgi:hypothetical protein
MRPQHLSTNKTTFAQAQRNPENISATNLANVSLANAPLSRSDRTFRLNPLRQPTEPRLVHQTIQHKHLHYRIEGEFIKKGLFQAASLVERVQNGTATFQDGKRLTGNFTIRRLPDKCHQLEGHDCTLHFGNEHAGELTGRIDGQVSLSGDFCYSVTNGKKTTDRDVQTGGFKNGLLDGAGKKVFKTAQAFISVEDGIFVEGKLHGQGQRVYSNNHKLNSIHGEFIDGIISSGTIIHRSGETHQGNFLKGKLHGEGEIVFSKNHELHSMSGVFKDGKIYSGTVIHRNGEIHTGTFINNRLAEGTITYANNCKIEFKNNVIVNLYKSTGKKTDGDFFFENEKAILLRLQPEYLLPIIYGRLEKNDLHNVELVLKNWLSLNLNQLENFAKINNAYGNIDQHYFQQLPIHSQKLHKHSPELGIFLFIAEQTIFAIQPSTLQEISVPAHDAEFNHWKNLVSELASSEKIAQSTVKNFLFVLSQLENQTINGVEKNHPWYATQYTRLGWIMQHFQAKKIAEVNQTPDSPVMRHMCDSIQAVARLAKFCGPGLEDELIVHYNGWVTLETTPESSSKIAFKKLVHDYFEDLIKEVTRNYIHTNQRLRPNQEIHIGSAVQQLGQQLFGLNEYRHDLFSYQLNDIDKNTIKKKISLLFNPTTVIDLITTRLPPSKDAIIQTAEAVELLNDFFKQSQPDGQTDQARYEWLHSNYDKDSNFTRTAAIRMLISTDVLRSTTAPNNSV